MKAIILAAGCGTRLDKYTKEMPKAMLNVFGKSLIEHQVDVYRKCGITDIIIIKGYKAEKINIEGTRTFINPLYNKTNMVESLFCAKEELEGDIIISYGDVLVEPKVLAKVIANKCDIGVLVDVDWKDYWFARYGKVDFDTESLSFDGKGNIIELGQSNPKLKDIDGRYVGMIRLSSNGATIIKQIYENGAKLYRNKPWLNGRNFENIYMTDFLQEMINQKHAVKSIQTTRGWLEFDTNEDYEKMSELAKTKSINSFINIEEFH
jgi:choline kinase